jgi:hypothetical protein
MDKFTERGTDGSVDLAASANAYTRALAQWCAENEIPAEQITEAVNSVLDRHAGKNIPMPALLSLASQELGADALSFKVISDRVHAYVTGQTEAGLLFVTKGKGGGVSRERPIKKTA